jgi:hypothetical protein
LFDGEEDEKEEEGEHVLELEMLIVIFGSFDLHVIPSYKSYDPVWQPPFILLSIDIIDIEEHSMKPNNVSNSEFEDPFGREISNFLTSVNRSKKLENRNS